MIDRFVIYCSKVGDIVARNRIRTSVKKCYSELLLRCFCVFIGIVLSRIKSAKASLPCINNPQPLAPLDPLQLLFEFSSFTFYKSRLCRLEYVISINFGFAIVENRRRKTATLH